MEEDPLIGARLDGRYQVLERIGRGGMGSVYLAEEVRLRRLCALKVLHPQLGADRSNVERFLREAQTLARLGHPNIIDIHAFGEEPSGVVFFAMELLQGEDFDVRIRGRAERPYTTHEACLWAIQIARAVAVVHDAGLIHRDLKTSNVFLATRRDGDEVVKLLDFGIARPEDASDLTNTGVSLGTPNYMAPEQIRSLPLDRRADIYAFGVLLCKLLTGRVPFLGDPIQVAMQHCDAPPPRPSLLAPAAGISAAVDAIVVKALAKRPEDRFQSMQAVEQALVDVLAAEAPELAPAPTQRRARVATAGATGTRAPTGPVPAMVVDAATPPASARTGPTTMTPPRRVTWWLPLLTLGSVGAVGAVVAVVLASGRPGASETAPLEDPSIATASPGGLAATAPTTVVATPAQAPAAAPVAAAPPAAAPPPAAVAPEAAPVDSAARKAVAVDPIQGIKRRAKACRREHDAVGGPPITIDYAIGIDGVVVRSIASTPDALGKCLSDAVKLAQFPAKFMLGQTLKL